MNKIRKFFHLREKKLVIIQRVHLISANLYENTTINLMKKKRGEN